ncbi:hypothetical protein [Flavobacterium sp. HNIBRBA15423]|uniref:hypothetical protein n=1 Tax=Flavobacterium sp. HNIBRBA15423 TaxID=3458683 RepID=UPI00404443AD
MIQKEQVKKVEKEEQKATSLKVVETPKTTEKIKNEENLISSKMNAKEEIRNIFSNSTEEKLLKLEHLTVLSQKFRALKGMRDDLTKFILSSDGSKEKIELSNSSGFKFIVSNTQTIEKVLELIESELNLFISKADKEIQEFSI